MTSQTATSPAAGQYELSHLRSLEAEAIHIIREVAAEFERPVLLFSGGKDSIVMLHLALKAFRPGRLPFPVMHVDTGHNFDEVLQTRDELVQEAGVRLIVAKVQADIDAGRVVATIPSRNPLQTVTLLRAIRENNFDAAFGGAGREAEKIKLPSIYYAHQRKVFERDGMLLAVHKYLQPRKDEAVIEKAVRFRTVGDVTCTGCVESLAGTVSEVIAETAVSRLTERGATRADDRISEAGMEDRKREGYF